MHAHSHSLSSKMIFSFLLQMGWVIICGMRRCWMRLLGCGGAFCHYLHLRLCLQAGCSKWDILCQPESETNPHRSGQNTPSLSLPPTKGLLGCWTLAGMLSEALCSRPQCVSECRPKPNFNSRFNCDLVVVASAVPALKDEVPFVRHPREQGKMFRGEEVDGQFPWWIFTCAEQMI